MWEDYYVNYEEMNKPGFYLSLQPVSNMVDTIRLLIAKYPNIEVEILSAAFSEAAIEEKNQWLDTHLWEITSEHRHFVRVGEDKTKVFGGDVKGITLLDDYTRNLHKWQDAGGRGIKLLNGENNASGKWKGDYVFFRTEPAILAATLAALCEK